MHSASGGSGSIPFLLSRHWRSAAVGGDDGEGRGGGIANDSRGGCIPFRATESTVYNVKRRSVVFDGTPPLIGGVSKAIEHLDHRQKKKKFQ